MAKDREIPPGYGLEAKWEACVDITLRRLVYSSLAGATSALLLFRSPTMRWSVIAFGAGVGLGSAYTDCSHIFDGRFPKWPSSSNVPPSSSSQDEIH